MRNLAVTSLKMKSEVVAKCEHTDELIPIDLIRPYPFSLSLIYIWRRPVVPCISMLTIPHARDLVTVLCDHLS